MNESEQNKLSGFCPHGNFPGECLACKEAVGASEQENLNSHLAEGVRPIMTSIGTFEDYQNLEKEHPELPNLGTDMGLKSATNVDWYGGNKAIAENDLLNAGEYTYVISKIDSTDKLSRKFAGCTGLVVVGSEKESGQDISFMSHQNLTDMTAGEKEEFLKHLEQRLAEIKDRCTSGTIDVVVIGGKQRNELDKKYSMAISLLTEEVKKDLGFEPVVIGPKINGVYDDVYYKDRKLFLVRSDVDSKITPFRGGQVDSKIQSWHN